MQGTMKKVLIPVVNEKTGKTWWARGGVSFVNRDGSWNVYLDVLPKDGKLQIRDFDEADRRNGPRTELGAGAPDPGSTEGSQIPF